MCRILLIKSCGCFRIPQAKIPVYTWNALECTNKFKIKEMKKQPPHPLSKSRIKRCRQRFFLLSFFFALLDYLIIVSKNSSYGDFIDLKHVHRIAVLLESVHTSVVIGPDQTLLVTLKAYRSLNVLNHKNHKLFVKKISRWHKTMSFIRWMLV